MTTGQTCINVDHLTINTDIVEDEITLTFEDILEMFSDRGADTDGITALDVVMRTFGGRLRLKTMTSENAMAFRIRKTTVT